MAKKKNIFETATKTYRRIHLYFDGPEIRFDDEFGGSWTIGEITQEGKLVLYGGIDEGVGVKVIDDGRIVVEKDV